MTAKGKRRFVKYRNRKLHEEGSPEPYTSMSDLVEVVAAGDDVVVVDDATGEDLTLVTLARILYDICREDGKAVKVQAIRKLITESSAA